MKKWEYLSRYSPPLDMLDALGKDGWELLFAIALDVRLNAYTFYFKREIEDENL